MRTDFKNLGKNLQDEKELSSFFTFCMSCKWSTIHSHKAAEREFKVMMFGVNFYTILPRYKYTDS